MVLVFVCARVYVLDVKAEHDKRISNILPGDCVCIIEGD